MERLILRGIDTNIVIRMLLRDDPGQVEAVDTLVAGGDLFVPFTVLIEAEWVLRAVYRLDREAVSQLLAQLTAIEGVNLPDLAGVLWACARHAAGADFADMIHIVATREHESFISFDLKLMTQAGPDTPITIETLI